MNIRPSKASREAGVSAAMAAFDAQFEAETATAKEKISSPDQGLAGETR